MSGEKYTQDKLICISNLRGKSPSIVFPVPHRGLTCVTKRRRC